MEDIPNTGVTAPTFETPAARPRLSELPVGAKGVIEAVEGERSVRRRLMELGLVPGTPIAVVNIAPLGDPLELAVRGGRLSIRRVEAATISLRGPIEPLARRRLKVVR